MFKKLGLFFYILMVGSLFFGLQIALGESPTPPTCPIGTDGAPNLRDQGTGAQCRGACGENCPSDRCEPMKHIIIPIYDTSGQQYNCVYNNVINCLTHQGCRDHDACYDRAVAAGEYSLKGPLHLKCNDDCFKNWTTAQCAAWSDITGYVADYWVDPDFDGVLLFSDPPVVFKSPNKNSYSGEAISEKSGKTWPFKLALIGPDMDSSISGQIEWTSLNSIHQIVGSKTTTGITFTETADIKKGGAVLNCKYNLTSEGNSFTGTWDSCNDGDYGTISMKTE